MSFHLLVTFLNPGCCRRKEMRRNSSTASQRRRYVRLPIGLHLSCSTALAYRPSSSSADCIRYSCVALHCVENHLEALVAALEACGVIDFGPANRRHENLTKQDDRLRRFVGAANVVVHLSSAVSLSPCLATTSHCCFSSLPILALLSHDRPRLASSSVAPLRFDWFASSSSLLLRPGSSTYFHAVGSGT
ncbi:hypothetical protein IWZ01DRAFT_125402 [Phyllosticta capitalensis]